MTPWGKADSLLKDLISAAGVAHLSLPERRYAQLGEPVVACAAVQVALTGLEQAGPEYQPQAGCVTAQVGTFVVIIARDCAVVFNDDGTDDPKLVVDVSQDMSEDGDFLWNWANEVETFITKTMSLSWILEGGLSITSVSMTLGVD